MKLPMVTVAEYAKYLAETNAKEPLQWAGQQETPEWPVVYVDWYEAQAYCNWRGGRLLSADELDDIGSLNYGLYEWTQNAGQTRGGSWYNDTGCKKACRFQTRANLRICVTGFRCKTKEEENNR